MQTKHYLTLSDAEFLLDQAHQYSIQNNFNVSIAVVDETGSALAMKRMDGASPMTASLSLEKAKCSALSRCPTKLLEDLIKNGQLGFLSLDSFSGMLEGAEPISISRKLRICLSSLLISLRSVKVAHHGAMVLLLKTGVWNSLPAIATLQLTDSVTTLAEISTSSVTV